MYTILYSVFSPPQVLSYYSVRRSYLPIEVAHSTEVRDARTNELVSLWPASDYAAVKQRFERATRFLAASKEFRQLKSTLASVAIPSGIDKIVAFACATMTWAGNDITRSMAQHALALAVRDFLANGDMTGADGEGAGGIKCYAQDPIYTPVDERVLSEAGFTVVDDPRAFLEVDESKRYHCHEPRHFREANYSRSCPARDHDLEQGHGE